MPNFALKIKISVIIIICGLCFGTSKAQTTTPATPASLIEDFFRSYKDNTREAVTDLFKTNPLVDSAKVDEVIKAIEKERKNLGNYFGKELITQKKATASLVLYSYLAKHTVQPVRYTFMFYKPQTEWVIYRFYFDGNIETELQDSAKL